MSVFLEGALKFDVELAGVFLTAAGAFSAQPVRGLANANHGLERTLVDRLV